ncbi:hypothetical protein HX792_25075 [Pseudomonas sp. B6002]|uniref:hypothetical protein n=1 Tax=Pseudomonas sp. B6002 TaxID=2726978 RepID=UPI0015A0B93D|nr:hypothetical protein [Pseudomonas sp. B6002]NVZ53636.1 hypothetical protein [Pseudomonas sp. B6002]
MQVDQFCDEIKSLLDDFMLERSSFANGEFGDLERVELEGLNKLVTVDFWSKGWIAIDVYDCPSEQQIMNVLLSPEEVGFVSEAFDRLMNILVASKGKIIHLNLFG